MKSVKMDFVRDGDGRGVFEKERIYHVSIDSATHRQFAMPLSQEDFLTRLAELRYHKDISDEVRTAALKELSQVVTKILEPPEFQGPLQIDVLTDAQELWALPLELALARDGQPLLVKSEPATVLTRRVPRDFVERQLNWPARPRILFAYASPKWASDFPVEHSKHEAALLSALQPWIEPIPGQPGIFGRKESVLTTLKEASVEEIAQACRQAEADGSPYSHVHLLAHGVKCVDPIYSFKSVFGIALRSDNNTATKPADLVQALWPKRPEGWEGAELPVVVTLAVCDGGNAENSIVAAGGMAEELHRAGVPIVVASQLPLTFPGSEILTRTLYAGWMDGQDVRNTLHATRVALYESKEAGHDWVSMVAYVWLPAGYSDYLLDVRLKNQLAALETASKHANYLLDNNITDGAEYDQVTDRLQRRIKRLEDLLEEHKAVDRRRKNEIIQENAGLLGSAYKRLAELLANRANVDPNGPARWREESRVALTKARDVYQQGFRQNPAHHWTGVQYLALDAVLTGSISSLADWYACYVAATAQRDNSETSESDRVWALGSVMELCLLGPLNPALAFPVAGDAAALTDLSQRVRAEKNKKIFPNTFPIDSTHRQLTRYASWWTKANSFFSARESDLSGEAKKLIELL